MGGDDLRFAGDAKLRPAHRRRPSWLASRNRCPSGCRPAVGWLFCLSCGKIELRNRAFGKAQIKYGAELVLIQSREVAKREGGACAWMRSMEMNLCFASWRLRVFALRIRQQLIHDDRQQNHDPARPLIPYFVVETLYYVETGNEVHRLVALLAFAITAICGWRGRLHCAPLQPTQRTRRHPRSARGQDAARVRRGGC